MKNKIATMGVGLSVLVADCVGANAVNSGYDNKSELVEKAQECKLIDDRLGRLNCFDKIFGTPIPLAKPRAANISPEVELKPKPVNNPLQLLASKVVGDLVVPQKYTETIGQTTFDPWVIKYRRWGADKLVSLNDDSRPRASEETTREILDKIEKANLETSEKYDIFIATPEVTLADAPAKDNTGILLLTCQNDITTLHLVLRKQQDGYRLPVSISSADGARTRDFIWRDIEDRHVFIAGRGLDSIDIMRSFVNFDNIDVTIGEGKNSQTYRFNTRNFSRYMSVLKTACHW